MGATIPPISFDQAESGRAERLILALAAELLSDRPAAAPTLPPGVASFAASSDHTAHLLGLDIMRERGADRRQPARFRYGHPLHLARAARPGSALRISWKR
jgi:hypothetical protein